MQRYTFFLMVLYLIGTLSHCGNSSSNNTSDLKVSISESISSKAGEKQSLQPETISDYFKEIPESYVSIPMNRRVAVLNAANPEQSVTIKVAPQKVMRYYRGELDEKNAYLMVYSVNDGGSYQMCYWNQSDGNRLIGLVRDYGYDEETQVAKQEIFFFRYDNGKWNEVNNLLPRIKYSDFLSASFLKKYQLDGNQLADFYYSLPQKGKDIKINFDAYAQIPNHDFSGDELDKLTTSGVLYWKDAKFELGKFTVPQ